MASQGDSSSWGPDQLQRRLQAMDDFQFEHLIADLWEQQGWTTEVEQQSSDAGVDIRATKSQPYPRKALIQAKRYSDKNPRRRSRYPAVLRAKAAGIRRG